MKMLYTKRYELDRVKNAMEPFFLGVAADKEAAFVCIHPQARPLMEQWCLHYDYELWHTVNQDNIIHASGFYVECNHWLKTTVPRIIDQIRTAPHTEFVIYKPKFGINSQYAYNFLQTERVKISTVYSSLKSLMTFYDSWVTFTLTEYEIAKEPNTH